MNISLSLRFVPSRVLNILFTFDPHAIVNINCLEGAQDNCFFVIAGLCVMIICTVAYATFLSPWFTYRSIELPVAPDKAWYPCLPASQSHHWHSLIIGSGYSFFRMCDFQTLHGLIRLNNDRYPPSLMHDTRTRRIVWYHSPNFPVATWAQLYTQCLYSLSSIPSNRSEIWWAPRQQCCRDVCQISERYDQYSIQSRGFETSRDFAVRRAIA